MTFVALDRQFTLWDEKEEIDVNWFSYFGATYGSFGWPKLLEGRRVVILAEAGSGKSVELKERSELLGREGKFSFYTTVQEVAQEGLVNVLRVIHRDSFDAWKSSDEPAWFFIDSMDEAKLDNIRFEIALRRISDGINGARSRAHIILSGRYTDWEFRADLDRLNEILPVPIDRPTPAMPTQDQNPVQSFRRKRSQKTEDKGEQPLIVVMAPLDPARVRLFAQSKGVQLIDKFMDDIESANLWSFARRPLDLQWLIEYWVTKNGRFGPFAEMIETSLSERLIENNPQYARSDEIPIDHAMHALERIGAAFVFGRKDKLIIPDSKIPLATALPSDFDLAHILPDWSTEHQSRLLMRAVFDPATFGRIRLHNDNEGVVRSYLAARWLLHRRSQPNFSVSTLKDLLFSSTYGVSLIKPSVRQTAAWLAIWDPDVAREIIKLDPGLLLTAGDPGSLSVDTRRSILEEVVARVVSEHEEVILSDHRGLRRFSTPDLVPQIQALWDQHKNNHKVRTILLMMVWLGKLSDCIDIALEAVFEDFGDFETLVFGARALLDIADVPTLARYTEKIKGSFATLPGLVLWEALDHLFLNGITVDELLAMLRDMDETLRDEGNGFQFYGPRFVARLFTRVDLERLLVGLLEQLGDASSDLPHYETPVEKAYYPAIAAAAHALMQLVDEHEAPLSAVDAVLRLSEGRNYDPNNDATLVLQSDMQRTTARRRIGFWRAVAKANGHKILMKRPIHFPGQLNIVGWAPNLFLEDVDWLLDDATTRNSDDERLLVINTAMDIWRYYNKPEDILERIKGVTNTHPTMTKALNARLNPPEKTPELIELERKNEELQRRHKEEQTAQNQAWIDFLEPLKANPNQLRQLPAPTPEYIDRRLYNLWELLQRADDRESRFAIDDVSPLKTMVGPELASETRDALIRFWRQWKPTLDSSRPPDKRNVISKIDCMGITGVSLEARKTENWPKSLTSVEATLAASYATIELNGFPSWLTSLAAAWPHEVSAVLMHEIISEIDDPASEVHFGVLHDVANSPPEIARVVSPSLMVEVENRADIPSQVLSLILEIIPRGLLENQKEPFTKIALDRFLQFSDIGIAALYLGAVFKINPQSATNALCSKLVTLSPSEQTSLAQRVLPQIFGHRFKEGVEYPKLTFDVLRELVFIAFQTIRKEDDNQRNSGVVYSPNERDDAESARNAAFNQFIKIPGRATFDTLLHWAEVPNFAVKPKRLQELAIERAKEDSENTPWPASEASKLEEEFDAAPRTPAELQGVVMSRLMEIQHSLHNDDYAQPGILKSLQNEREVQKWIASKLRDRQGRAYSVEREPQVFDDKEPDIRVRAKVSDASLPIEIKIPEKWSLNELERALTGQLGSRYLRAQNEKHGVLLLVHQNQRKMGWKLDGRFLTFPELIDRLQNIADTDAGKSHDSPQVRVSFLDVSNINLEN